jgi:hypothetical protein
MSSNVEDLINALQQGDMSQANQAFETELASRVATSLDAHKSAVASSIYGEADEVSADYDEDIADELEDDVEDTDEEDQYEEDVEEDE